MPNDKMSGHFAFWCHISTTFQQQPPQGLHITYLGSEATIAPKGPWPKAKAITKLEGVTIKAGGFPELVTKGGGNPGV